MRIVVVVSVVATVLVALGFGILFANWISYDRISIKEQAATGVGANGSVIRFIQYGADYMRGISNPSETGNFLSGQYYDSIFGLFTLDWSPSTSDNVRIGWSVGDCATGSGYKLVGNAYSETFGFVSFSDSSDQYVYYCPFDKKLYGYAYGEWVGFQNFTGIELISGTAPELGGVKILWQGQNEQFEEILTDQNIKDLHIRWEINKSLQLSQIKKRVFAFIRRVRNDETGIKKIADLNDFSRSANRWGKVFQEGNVIYFQGNGERFVTLGDGTVWGVLDVRWKKTILVIGADLYITSNLTYNDKANDILGVIVLQDENGRGGHIVVHPDVTNLVGTLVAERVLESGVEYAGHLEIHDGSTDETVLANQLHIFGSLMSENTIGQSVRTPPECPFYVEQADCLTASQAQRFDLNFLRRFKIDLYGDPAHGGKVAGGGTCVAWTCSGGNPALMKIISSTSDELANYPLIIEYNPKVQLTPPLLLSQ